MTERATLHALVFAQAKRTPDAVAIDDGSKTTYRELRDQAKQVAASLRAEGVGRGDFVGICVSREAHLISILLGVLASGAAYVPLDAAYPKDRLRYMISDCGAPVVICEEKFSDLFDSKGLTVLSPETLLRPQGQDQAAESARVDPEDLAYLLYTSGSTGNPKGVMIKHRSAVNLARWAQDAFLDEDRSRILFSTSLSWDLSIFEIFAALAWGGTLVMVENVLSFAETGPELNVTLVNTSPSVMTRLVRHHPLPESVRVVTLAGEVLHGELVDLLHQQHPTVRVWNLYGPTETTTFSTGGEIQRGHNSAPPIGPPLRNTLIYLLDDEMKPVNVGEVGEIWIGGEGVASGYLNRPELTEEAFVADPFSEGAQGRLYRTGDQARSDVDGSIVVLGRVDHQVKLHGLRIELGEIDAHFLENSSVAEAVTVVSRAGTGEPRLVGYLAPRHGREIDLEQVRAGLARTLPPHMVPALITVLDELPLNPNGKIDRAALPAPAPVQPVECKSSPLSKTEQEIANIFGALLGVDPPTSPEADFFEWGGDSLAALQFVDLIAERLQVEIALSALFEQSEVGQIAAQIDERELGLGLVEARPSGLYALRSAGTKQTLFLGPLGNGGLRGYRQLVEHLDPDRPVYGMQAPGVDGERLPFRTVEEMGRHFAEEIAGFQPAGPILLGGFSYGGVCAVDATQHLRGAGRESNALRLLDTSPFSSRIPWRVAPKLRLRQERDSLIDTYAEVGLLELIRRRGYQFVVRTRRYIQRRWMPTEDEIHQIMTVHQRAVEGYQADLVRFPIVVIEGAGRERFDRATVDQDPRALSDWRHFVIDCPDVPHREFLSEPTASKVADELNAVLVGAHRTPGHFDYAW